MSDRYQSLIRTPVGQLFAKNLGLPNPVPLERYREGDPLVTGLVALGGRGRLVTPVVAALDDLAIAHVETPQAPAESGKRRYKALVFDATGLTASDRLAELQGFFAPLLRSLETCPRVVVLGTPPEEATSAPERVAQRALEGFARSLGKEIGRGGTVQLVYVARGAEDATSSTLAFLLSPKSAYVSGQVIRVGVHGAKTAVGVGRTGRDRSRERWRWSPAPAGASESRSPEFCIATVPRSSGSTYPRRPMSCSR
jgi:3-oxoacyl-[acyl-carrier protein] reductase